MPTEFIPVTIGQLDPEETYKRSGEFWEKVFFLHPLPPEGWAEAFHEVWAGAIMEPKRPARIENGRLAIICIARELDGELMEYLLAAVERTNHLHQTKIAADLE